MLVNFRLILLVLIALISTQASARGLNPKPSISNAVGKDLRIRPEVDCKRLAAEKKNDYSVVADAAISSSTKLLGEKLPLYTKIFPVYPKELLKFFSLSIMMFWIVFVFTMTRDTKDALIVTNCGAEAIAFLKVYGVIPAATAFMVLYTKMANSLSPNALFYATISPFFVFYFLFAFVMYPLRHVLHPLQLSVPSNGFSFAINLLRYWTFSLYYIVSELWGSAGIPLLFWSFANDVVRIDQAQRLYPLMSLIGNMGPILSGITMSVVSRQVARLIPNNDDKAFETSLRVLTLCMTAAGALVYGLHYFIRQLDNADKASGSSLDHDKNDSNANKVAASSSKSSNDKTKTKGSEPAVKKSKPKLSFYDSLKVLASDTYLRNVATMVLSYGLTIEFTEIMWKATVKKAFPVKTDYLNFMGRYSMMVGSSAFVMMFVGANIIKGLGWKAGAMMTPLMMGLTALPFFACMVMSGGSLDALGQKPLLVAVYVGLLQNVLSKATKYAIFDPTKEMAYIPLDREQKTKGKAAIDVLGARLGKSGGALAQQFLVIIFGNIIRGSPVVACLFYAVVMLWVGAVNDLAPKFKSKADEQQQQQQQQQQEREEEERKKKR